MSAHVASRTHTHLHPHHQLAAGTSAMRAAGGYSQANSGGGDLAILSAETYVDPGLSFLPSPPSTTNINGNNNKKTTSSGNGNASSSQAEGTSRKRLKRASPEEGGDREGDEEEKKRSRGRPRLDIKDETAADRRRTQIRLAQRAYRNRKENAIQTLERQVQELRDTNEEMSNAFMRLHDFAVNNGLVDIAPEFGRQLRSTTEKFLTLARLSSEVDSKVDADGEGGSGSPKQQQQQQQQQQQNSDGESSSPSKTSKTKQHHQQPQAVITPPPDTSSMSSILANKGNQVYGGFIVTHEPVIEDLLTSTEFTLPSSSSTTSNPNSNSNSSSSVPEYEIITQPTLDNASFPFPFDLSLQSLNPNQNQNNTLGITSPPTNNNEFNNFNTFSGSLFPTLSAPTSYASQEATFGRRLQRTGIERALVLITMPNPPAKLFNRIFGFCLMLESKEAIYKRLMRGIQKTVNESLNYWGFPFYNLGGAGTQLLTPGSDSEPGNGRMGNSGTVDVMKPIVSGTNGGYNMGPFTAQTSSINDKLLDRDMRVNSLSAGAYLNGTGNEGLSAGLLGGGEYFDCDEVEIYLHQRGVVIPPAADFITAEVETGLFEVGNLNGDGDGSAASEMASSGCGIGPGGNGSSGSSSSPGNATASGSADGDLWGLAVDPMLSQLDGDTSRSGRNMNAKQASTTSTRKMVTVDINLLVYELTERTVCLGRTPGIKQEDINVAFWKASQVLA